MTVLRRVTVRCDHKLRSGEQCQKRLEAPEGVQSKRTGQELARKAGWHLRSYGEFCPQHKPRLK